MKKNAIYIVSVCLGAVLNFIVNVLLIGKMGAMGAVVGTIVGEVSVTTYQTIAVRKDLDIKIYFKNSISFFLAGIIMFCLVRVTASIMTASIISIMVKVAFGAVVYLSITMLYFIKTKNRMILDIFLKISPKFKIQSKYK